MLSGKRIFLTGGAGFIGSTLIRELVERNRIFVYDNCSRDSLSQRPYANHANLLRIDGDVLDSPHLAEAMASADPQLVVHLAAIAGIETVLKSPTKTMRVNMVGTVNAL